MDAYNTDVRPLLRGPARGARPAPGPDRRVQGLRLRRSGSGRADRRHSRPAGAPDQRRARDHPLSGRGRVRGDAGAGPDRPLEPLGADPRNTNYAGGNTSAKGTATDPVTGGRRAALGQGLRRRPGHADRAGAGGAAAGPAARAGRRLPGRRPRGRDGRRVRLLPVRPGGAAPSIDTAMHGLVDAAHVDHLHPDSGIALATAADGETLTARVLRRPGGVGALAAARASSSAWTSPRSRTRTRRRSG